MCLMSCKQTNKLNMDKEEDNFYFQEATYKGHNYLILRKGSLKVGGIVHDGNCQCHKRSKE